MKTNFFFLENQISLREWQEIESGHVINVEGAPHTCPVNREESNVPQSHAVEQMRLVGYIRVLHR